MCWNIDVLQNYKPQRENQIYIIISYHKQEYGLVYELELEYKWNRTVVKLY